MTDRLRIVPVRRRYNQFVANETLEDYALRFTAKQARRWSAVRVGNTALGAVSFLALEAIGGAITLNYGFENAAAAILVVSALIFLTGLPIAYYAARDGLDIDLLTRGAGFGYIGSTITSLIYASFTFIFFAIEAAIMALALELCFGVPLAIGYVVSAVVVIPIVTHGIAWISRFQVWTQPLWIALHLTPLVFIAAKGDASLAHWIGYEGASAHGGALNLLGAGAAGAVVFALVAQIGEQVDILRFMPERKKSGRAAWWSALIAAGPGWIVPGAVKMMIGSFLAVLALSHGVPASHAGEPTQMYLIAFSYVTSWPAAALGLTAAFVVISQLKINVTNAYAGSIAWSNFFSRLTHSHPGRIVWLFFNVGIAVLLMEAGIYKTLEHTLGLYSIVAVAWLGALVADLTVNKPLGLSPKRIEFKRAHLYDVNPVGVGAMVVATAVAMISYAGAFGAYAQALAPFVALAVAMATAPLIAIATGGRYYLARKPRAEWRLRTSITCKVCENAFEPEDMAHCPVYSGAICSLCCSIDARCRDGCKPHARYQTQVVDLLKALLPQRWIARLNTRTAHFSGVFATLLGILSLVLLLVHFIAAKTAPEEAAAVAGTLWAVFLILAIIAGVAAWLFVLAHESREIAQEESSRQTALLMREIEAHKRTDAALQRAKEVAEAANLAKSRYVVGINHELRTPLNAVLGYAQLLDAESGLSSKAQTGVRVIRRSAEHLAGLLDGLLDIAKVEAGRLKLAREDIWTREFLGQLADMFRLQAAAKGVAFVFEGETALPPVVRGDGKRLRQVLINLLSNAVKFTAAGRVTLRVTYRSQVATFEIVDTGPGIPPEDRDRIFEPFERGGSPLSPAQPGMGLGLTITKLLVEVMGGEIALETESGRGSAFRVKLMLPHVPNARPPIAPSDRIIGYVGRRRLVLVADDDADQRNLMRAALEPLGFTVIAATHGAAALEMAAERTPDLVLLDVSMPGPSGWEVARRLRAALPETRIIMMSANISDAPLDGHPAHHDGAMPKPIDLQALLGEIERLLRLNFVTERPAPDPGPAPAADAPMRRPSNRHVEELTRLGEMGYIAGIEAKLVELESADLGSGPFVSAARDRIRAFDLRGYMAMLERSEPLERGDV
ncbi:hybrid sensor histidine kinase/response regulator [Methylopila jiangsuensis]|uniref:histidine kinase n=1 Tax=Methylopila jiangsuensis TaxID=586230 RepID=A0A9W6JG11_9HYPH|nr:ATP-binding protein [Methylopila jiangsuensis]MDR6287469.1 signal transduction histidine kinase/CheY-like chemotaxis protein [Methylopila jiangsuensis]GLK75049.1 hybrid sensor histidine kinase/response regulator [Methylopila jiangsuensis]